MADPSPPPELARSEPAGQRRRGRPRRDEAEALHRDFLRHALDHFLDKGFEATTVQSIAQSFGMSKRTVYARYDDKIALFQAALQGAVDDWLEPLDQLHRLESEDLEQSLIDVSRVVVATLISPAGLRLIRITNAELFRMPELARRNYRLGRARIAAYLGDLLRRKIPGLESREEAEDLATAFLNLLSGPALLTAWSLEAEAVDIDRFVRRRVRLFLRGAESLVGAPPPLRPS